MQDLGAFLRRGMNFWSRTKKVLFSAKRTGKMTIFSNHMVKRYCVKNDLKKKKKSDSFAYLTYY